MQALQLTKALSSARFEAGCDHLAEVTEELDRGIESARHDTQGSHKTAKVRGAELGVVLMLLLSSIVESACIDPNVCVCGSLVHTGAELEVVLMRLLSSIVESACIDPNVCVVVLSKHFFQFLMALDAENRAGKQKSSACFLIVCICWCTAVHLTKENSLLQL